MASVDAGIYGGRPLYWQGESLIDDLRRSGMSTIVAWALHVEENGGLVFNDAPIVADGRYIGAKSWPDELARLKVAPTSVEQLSLSVGGWSVDAFRNIQKLIREQGIGPTSTLYRNFAALRATIPTIDTIDFCDETLYDEATTVKFALLLHSLDYAVSFCPYKEPDFWVACLKKLNTPVPDVVVGFNLQCFGHPGNTPEPWIDAIAKAMGPSFDAAGFVRPGLWCAHGEGCNEGHCPDSIEQTLRGWRSLKLSGGWIWMLDYVLDCQDSGACSGGVMDVARYAEAIATGLGGEGV